MAETKIADIYGTISGGTHILIIDSNRSEVSGNLYVTGTTTLNGDFTSGDTSVSTFDSTGATSLATDSGVVNIASTGVMTTVKGALNVKGTLNVDEAVTLDTTLNITGATTLTGAVEITNEQKAQVTINYGTGELTQRSAALIVHGGVLVKSPPTPDDLVLTNPRIYSFISEGEGFFRGGLECENGINLFSGDIARYGHGIIYESSSNTIGNPTFDIKAKNIDICGTLNITGLNVSVLTKLTQIDSSITALEGGGGGGGGGTAVYFSATTIGATVISYNQAVTWLYPTNYVGGSGVDSTNINCNSHSGIWSNGEVTIPTSGVYTIQMALNYYDYTYKLTYSAVRLEKKPAANPTGWLLQTEEGWMNLAGNGVEDMATRHTRGSFMGRFYAGDKLRLVANFGSSGASGNVKLQEYSGGTSYLRGHMIHAI